MMTLHDVISADDDVRVVVLQANDHHLKQGFPHIDYRKTRTTIIILSLPLQSSSASETSVPGREHPESSCNTSSISRKP